MGINENDESSVAFVEDAKVGQEFTKYITRQLVITNGTEVKENNEAYLIDVKKEQSAAKEGKERRLPLFVGEKDGKTFYIAPIRGKGLWDAVWAYVAMDENMVIQGAYFDHQGETAGLGANIKERFFMDDFIGEHLLDESGNFVGINISKSNADPLNNDKTDNEVDAIAGATITGDGVAAMLRNDLKLYVPYFKTLKNN
jgi:Na+-transporting NADH:ubiquinone oxidoreductase subunit C